MREKRSGFMSDYASKELRVYLWEKYGVVADDDATARNVLDLIED